MEIEIRREIITWFELSELREMLDKDCKQGRFWFRIYINNCRNVNELFDHLSDLNMFEFQARKICLGFGDHMNCRGEKLSEICGIKEGVQTSFMVSAASKEELEEKMNFFVEGAKKMKEAVNECLSQKIPAWTMGETFIKI